MADSVGKGIALGERFKYDTTSGTAAFNNALNKRYNEKAAAEKNVVDALDFKIDYKEWLPLYGKAAAEKQAELYNKYLTYKSENKATALNRIQTDLYNAKQELGRLKGNNDRAKTYVTQKEGLFRNAALVNDLTSTETNLSDISKYNDGYFIIVGANGEFAFRPVEQMNPSSQVKFDPHDYDMRLGKSKPVGIAGKTQIEEIEFVKPDAIARNAVSLTTNPQFRDNVLWARPDILALPEKDQYTAIYDEAFKISSQLAGAPQSKWRIVDLPNPSGGGSDKDKREKPQINGEFTESLLLTKDDGTRERRDVKYPWSVDVPNAKETSVPLDSRVIDYETNSFLKGDDVGKVVTFKPKKIYPQLIKSTGNTELYVIGTAQVDVEDRRKGRIVKEFSYKVPYDKVDGSIKASKYDLSEVEERFKETKLVPESGGKAVKQIKSSDISARAKAAGYTDQEYRKLLTEKGVKIID